MDRQNSVLPSIVKLEWAVFFLVLNTVSWFLTFTLNCFSQECFLMIMHGAEDIPASKQARNLRRCALKAGKTLTRKTENLAHLTYPHTESGMR